jgi:hypothetical protein
MVAKLGQVLPKYPQHAYYILEESITLRRSRPCSAATDSIHMIISANLVLVSKNLHVPYALRRGFK